MCGGSLYRNKVARPRNSRGIVKTIEMKISMRLTPLASALILLLCPTAPLTAFGKSAKAEPASAAAAPEDGGAWLEKLAEQSVIVGRYPRAVGLLRGLAALRPR